MKFKPIPNKQFRDDTLDSSCQLNFLEKEPDGSLIVSHVAPPDPSSPADYDIETLVQNGVDVDKKVSFTTDADIDSVSAIEDNLGSQLAEQIKSKTS